MQYKYTVMLPVQGVQRTRWRNENAALNKQAIPLHLQLEDHSRRTALCALLLPAHHRPAAEA